MYTPKMNLGLDPQIVSKMTEAEKVNLDFQIYKINRRRSLGTAEWDLLKERALFLKAVGLTAYPQQDSFDFNTTFLNNDSDATTQVSLDLAREAYVSARTK